MPRRKSPKTRRKSLATISDPCSAFERVYVVNLDRRPDRWREFAESLPLDWPFIQPQRWSAVDGQLVHPPGWWHAGGGAWGIYRSFLGIIERCLNEKVSSVLLLEDDALFPKNFRSQVIAWLKHVPSEWGMLYLGGQPLNVKQAPPRKLTPHLFQPSNLNRCHAWALRGNMLQEVYNHILQPQWAPVKDAKGKDQPAHIDHHLGRLHERHYHAEDGLVLCPPRWLVGQREDQSNIDGKEHGNRWWAHPSDLTRKIHKPQKVTRTVIAVLGPYRGGTSCVAGILHRLGVSMGKSWASIKGNPTGTYEAQHLLRFCQDSFREFSMTPKTSYHARVAGLRNWAMGRQRSLSGSKPIGAKHPSFCLMIPELLEAWPKVKFVVVKRPLSDVVSSLDKLNWCGSLATARSTTELLVSTRDTDLKSIDASRVMEISYPSLLRDPSKIVLKLAEFAGVKATAQQLANATSFVKPRLEGE